jgi:hypothetical protein
MSLKIPCLGFDETPPPVQANSRWPKTDILLGCRIGTALPYLSPQTDIILYIPERAVPGRFFQSLPIFCPPRQTDGRTDTMFALIIFSIEKCVRMCSWKQT